MGVIPDCIRVREKRIRLDIQQVPWVVPQCTKSTAILLASWSHEPHKLPIKWLF